MNRPIQKQDPLLWNLNLNTDKDASFCINIKMISISELWYLELINIFFIIYTSWPFGPVKVARSVFKGPQGMSLAGNAAAAAAAAASAAATSAATAAAVAVAKC